MVSASTDAGIRLASRRPLPWKWQRVSEAKLKERDGPGDNEDPGKDNGSPGHDLIEDLPPGPDRKVITKSSREEKDRSWLLRVFLGLLSFTLVANFACGAWLSAHAWAQVQPEFASVRDFLFQAAGVIIGFFFGSEVRRHRN